MLTILSEHCVKERTLEGFGPRLARLRKSKGLTQSQLGDLVGVSYRMIAHYERADAQPPGAVLPDLAHALGVTTDTLLGVRPLKEKADPRTARLLKRLQRVQELPPADQKALLRFLDALLSARTRKAS